jgi:hypothetical protein
MFMKVRKNLTDFEDDLNFGNKGARAVIIASVPTSFKDGYCVRRR